MTVILMLFVFGVFILVDYLTGKQATADIRFFSHATDGLEIGYTMADGGTPVVEVKKNK
jgi:hypothetical protein